MIFNYQTILQNRFEKEKTGFHFTFPKWFSEQEMYFARFGARNKLLEQQLTRFPISIALVYNVSPHLPSLFSINSFFFFTWRILLLGEV